MADKVVMVVVVDAGKVTVFGAPMVNVVNVLAPVTITAPEPEPVIDKLLNVVPPPAKVLLVADVSVIEIVDVPGVNVNPLVDIFQTVPVLETVHVLEPIVKVLVFPLVLVKVVAETLKLLALNVPP